MIANWMHRPGRVRCLFLWPRSVYCLPLVSHGMKSTVDMYREERSERKCALLYFSSYSISPGVLRVALLFLYSCNSANSIPLSNREYVPLQRWHDM